MLIPILTILLMSSCENGLIGLGEKVDIDSPEITLGKYADGTVINNGDYVHEIILLSGHIDDDIGVSSVKLTIVNSSTGESTTGTAQINYSAMTWSYSIDTTTFSDGEKDITIKVTDTSSKSNSTERLLYFDNTAPLVLVKEPVDYASESGLTNSIVTLKGEAIDQFNIATVDITLISGDGSVDQISPENARSGSWTSYLRSTGTGDYVITVIATDKAGNSSTVFYHIDDIYAENSDEYITASDIYDLILGNDVTTAGLTLEDLQNPSVYLTELPLTVDLAGDEPVITISNPDPEAGEGENVLTGASKALGSIVDDDSVNVSSLTVSIDGADFESVTSTSGSGLFVQWEQDLSSLGSGDHTIQVYVEDGFGVYSYSSIVDFIINLGAPDVTITSPVLGDYINTDSFTVSGAAADGEGITNVQISIDGGSTWIDVSITPSNNVSWSYDTASLTDGVKTIKVRASDDNKSTWSYANTQMTIDTQAPITSFIYPSANSYVNGEITIRGASSDNNSIFKTEIKIGDSESWVELDDELKYNWTYDINTLEYENDSDGTETSSGSGIYELQVYSRVTDIAGNITETEADDYSFLIDNELDRPTVNIISPSDDSNLGGSVTISGTSYDDDGEVYGVYMQIDVNTVSGDDPDFSDSVYLGVNGIDFNGDGSEVTTIDETEWYLVDGTSPWNVEMNTNGELYSTGSGHTGDIYIRVRAIDKDGGSTSITGEYKELHIRMDDTIPYIENLSPATNSYVKGTFSLSGDVIDESQIKHLELSYNGGADYYYIIKNGQVQSPYGSGSVTTDYSLNLDIDTTDIPDLGSITSDDITLRLKVTDSTYYYTLYSLNYYIDNNDPYGWLTKDLTGINGAGDNATISGRANDTGVVSGVEKIIAYFEKDGLFYDLRDGSTMDVTQDTIDGETFNFPTGIDALDYQVVIDSISETLSGSNSDGDGINEELNIGTDYEWKFNFDSTLVPDGSFTFHYVVFDNSGNTGHYTEVGYVKNNEPVIGSITLATDLNADGDTIDSNEYKTFTSAYDASSFTVKNDKLNITVNASGGNGTLRYSIKYDSVEKNGTLTDNSLLITDFTEMADSIVVNGSTFEIVVYDSTFKDDDDSTYEIITDPITLNMTFDNDDTVNPIISLNPLTQTEQDKTVGHLELQEDTETSIWSTIHSTYGDNDPKASGIISVSGTITDENYISQISVDSENNTMPVLTSWDGEQLISTDTSIFTIDEQTFDSEGHTIKFTYKWNTSDVDNIAGLNKVITFDAEDGSSNSATDVSLQVDVVPYISSLTTSITTSFSNEFARSASGKYSVAINSDLSSFETISISGFNLYPTMETDSGDSDVRISIDPDALDEGIKAGKGLTYIVTGSNYTSVDVNLNIVGGSNLSGSGYLTVITNFIPSINNINDDSENSEADYINPTLGDDRFLSVWDLRLLRNEFSLAANAVYPSMSMNGDNPEFSYENNAQGWGIAAYFDGTTEKKIYENWDLFTFTAIDHNSDGNQSLIYDINVVNGNYGNYNSGNYGGILTSYYYDVPNTSWNSWSYRFNDNQAWLENLVDEDLLTTAVLDRYQYPDIFTIGSTEETTVFYSVYDELKDKIIFRSYQVGTDNTLADVSGGRINDSGTALYTSLEQYENNGSFPEYDGGDYRFASNNNSGKTPDGQQLIDDTNTSKFTAVAATEDGSTAVIAYYDETGTGKVRLKYNNTPKVELGWVDLGVIDSGTGGEYIDMKIDSNDHIHIAYYDNNNGDLRYIYIPVTSFSSGSIGTPQKYNVDGYFDVGEKLTLELDSSNTPYIAYKGVNRSGKVAWLNGVLSDGANSSNQFTGSWEVMIVPTEINNSDSNKFSIGIDTNDLPVLGYTNGGLEYIRLLDDLTN